MTTDTLDTLQQTFGFAAFRPGQQEIIDHLLAGHSAAAVFPTGGGKSLCYQLPALLLPGITLVVSPLIALMKDQIDALAARGIAAQRLDSSLTRDEYRDVMTKIRSGDLRLLYVAPERFNNERFRSMILQTTISLFAVDEAHCISEWGHNFRPDYLKLVEFAKLCGAERVLALTATATKQVLSDIQTAFDIAPECTIRTGFYRPNLELQTTAVTSEQRDAYLLTQLQSRDPGPTVAYVTLQRTAEQVAHNLSAAGLPARAYHAGLKDEERSEIQEWFIQSDQGIVVATIAFGMGIDKSNIRYVYHYNLPKSLENYAQEIGRAGRDDQLSLCHMLACPVDLIPLENFIYGDTPTNKAIHSFVKGIFEREETEFDVSIHDLSYEHDIRNLVVRTLLTYLELKGYLVGGTPFYATYRFKPMMSSQEILGNFEGERREFLTQVLRHSRKAKTWFDIDLDLAAVAIDPANPDSRDRIVRALDYLGEQQMLEVQVAGVRNRYTLLKHPEDLTALSSDLYTHMVERESREIGRLGQVLSWIQLDGCQTVALASHFAEELSQPCGHCTWCEDHVPTILPERAIPNIDPDILQQAKTLQAERSEILDTPLALVRLLCGINSPKMSRARLRGNPLFGALGDVPFPEVAKAVGVFHE